MLEVGTSAFHVALVTVSHESHAYMLLITMVTLDSMGKHVSCIEGINADYDIIGSTTAALNLYH